MNTAMHRMREKMRKRKLEQEAARKAGSTPTPPKQELNAGAFEDAVQQHKEAGTARAGLAELMHQKRKVLEGASFVGTPLQVQDAVEDTAPPPTVQSAPAANTPSIPEPKQEGYASKDTITYDMLNPEQRLAVQYAEEGMSYCLIGPAGSGKTTSTKSVCTTLVESGAIGKLQGCTDKVLMMDAPAVAVLSFTNQAVRNIKEALPAEFKAHCSTIHKILEYTPVKTTVDVVDENGEATGDVKDSMYYAPKYGTQPDGKGEGEYLPHLDYIIIEEGGNVPEDLFLTLYSALPHPEETKFIFLGDLNQLPPVFGDAILGFKLLELPIVELKHTYRNVGLITKFAHRILEGKPILDKELEAEWMDSTDGTSNIKLIPFTKRIEPDMAVHALGKHFRNLAANGSFDEEQDVLLIPYNKSLGTIELNKYIMSGLDAKYDRLVHEVAAGFEKQYFAIGDKVLFNKTYCKIVSIEVNSTYLGDPTLTASKYLSRWGQLLDGYEFASNMETTVVDMEALMEASLESLGESTTRQASHIIELEVQDEAYSYHGRKAIWRAKSSGEVNGILPVHAMTVHKAQGSEFRKVWAILHHSHATLLSRELLYTLVTRARVDLEMYFTGTKTQHKIGGSVFSQGITKQEIPGRTMEEKLNYFRKKISAKSFKAQKHGLNSKLKALSAGY